MTHYPPLGLLSIAANLERHKHDVTFIDMLAEHVDLRKRLQSIQPDIVGVTCLTANSFSAYEVAKTAKNCLPQSLIYMGGQHASGLAEPILRRYSFIDAVVRGEGEYAMLPPRRGIIDAERIGDLDDLSYPARHLAPMKTYLELARQEPHMQEEHTQVMASRGCPRDCRFCTSSRFWGFQCRMRSPRNILGELQLLHDQYGVNDIRFFDDTLNLNRAWLLKLCDLLIESRLGVTWQALLRVDQADKELLERMVSAGCYLLDFGVESASPRVLETIGKHITIEQADRAVENAKSAGLLARTFFMVGLPNEEREDLRMTLRALVSIPSDYFSLAVCMLYPGSALGGGLSEEEWFRQRKQMDFIQANVPIYDEPRREYWNEVAHLIWSIAYPHKLEGYKRIQALSLAAVDADTDLSSHRAYVRDHLHAARDVFGPELLNELV
jgi:radical SAM superfamily enzyme YgiQ (UPF0313 family)